MSKIKVVKKGTTKPTPPPPTPRTTTRDIESTVESWIKEYQQSKEERTYRDLKYLGGLR